MTTRKYTSLPYTEYPTLAYGGESTRKPIDTIILHSTNSTYESAISWFNSPNAGTSAHYIIANDGRLAAMLEEYFVAYHSGNLQTNERSIGIEHEGYNGLVRKDSEYDTSAKLVADICKFYNIPCDSAHIKPHREIVATACPTDLDVNRIISSAKLILAGGQSTTDKRPGWFDQISPTEFGTTGWEKLTQAQIDKWATDLPNRKIAGGKWDQLCDKLELPHTASVDEVYNKLGCSPQVLAKAEEKGRIKGRQEIKTEVSKLA